MESLLLHPWIHALAGGALIGAAAVLLYAMLGRIAGISGIAYGSLWADPGDRSWRWLFLGGLAAGGLLAAALGAALPVGAVPPGLAIAAGLLVGAGTRLGNGCTSGHGVCGLARRSRRSLLSVLVFMGVGMLTATLLRPWLA
jgi:uncharacterized protein